jgi:hypothetical protein
MKQQKFGFFENVRKEPGFIILFILGASGAHFINPNALSAYLDETLVIFLRLLGL